MEPRTARALNELNRVFYEAHADSFGASRDAPWPGWERVLAALRTRSGSGAIDVLDVGCGNARFAAFLAPKLEAWGRDLSYTGVDASPALLAQARARVPASVRARFVQADLIAEALETALPRGPFDLVCAFGLLHHVPGSARRRDLVRGFADRLAPGGLLALTAWRFERFERFQRRRVGWEAYNEEAETPIDPADLEPGDHLLRWGDDSGPPRYCHFADETEIAAWVESLPLETVDCFQADGREGALNQYLVLAAPG